MTDIKLMQGDCLERMREIPAGSVDMVLTDLPYGTTACKWDTVIDLPSMWAELKRITKPNGAIVMTASQPFTTTLIASNLKAFAYSWVWDKKVGANFVQAKRMPLKTTEDVLVFCTSGKTPDYYPQMVARDKPVSRSKNSTNSGSIPIRGEAYEGFGGKTWTHKYPSHLLEFSCRARGQRGLHPTQKPVALMEYLILTYTNEGDTVLDFTMGSGTTGVACVNTGRKFIGIELDPDYFAIAQERIEKARQEAE